MQTTAIKMKGPAVIACLVCLVVGQVPSPKRITYEGNQVWKIANKTTTLKVLKSLEQDKRLTIWGLTPDGVDAMIHAGAVDQVREKLLENNLEYKVSMEDVQKAIDEENPKAGQDLEGRKGFRLTWNYYHNLDDIYDFLHYLEHTYPKLCTVRTIGGSAEGRPIKLLKISNGRKGNRAVFVEGGIHAREWISPATVTYIIYQFVSGYNKETSSMRGLDWYVVPVLNPDGYLYSYNIDRMWRKNRSVTKSKECLGVDLNRNWGYDWGKNGSSEDPCHNSYGGRKPFSEPETTSVARFFLDNPDIDWRGYVSIHSYGQYIVYPWGSPNAVLDDNAELNKVAKEAAVNIVSAGGETYTVGPAGLTIYPAAGISMDWAKGSQAIKYAYTIELRDTGRYAFLLPAKYIKPTAEEALIAVRTIAKAVAS